MEQESSHGDCAAGFGDSLRTRCQPPRSFADLIFADRQNVVHVSPDVFKVDGSYTLGPQAVGDGAGRLLGRD